MRYILIMIDVFSKSAWAVSVHSNDSKAFTAAFKQVLTAANPRHLRRLQTDKGKKFFNSDFQALMKRHDIQHFASKSEQKAAVVERFNRIIKTRIWTYLTERGIVRWVDVIQNLVNSSNYFRYRFTGMSPANVQKKDENRLWVRHFGNGDTHLKPQIL